MEPNIDDFETDTEYLIALECYLIEREAENEAMICELEQQGEE